MVRTAPPHARHYKRHLAIIATLLASTVLTPPAAAHAHAQGSGTNHYEYQYIYTSQDTLAALEQASPQAECIVYYETGGTYDPTLTGQQGELGPVQLHPYGLLPVFYQQGYTNPFNPYEAIPFLEQQIQAGNAWNWSPVLLGWC